MASEFGGELESALFSKVNPLDTAPSSYWAAPFLLNGQGVEVFISPPPKESGLWGSINASLLNQKVISSELVADSLKKIEAHYIITEGKEWVTRLLRTQRGLSKLLLEAVQPLRRTFGDRLIQLQGVSDGEDLSLVANVQWPEKADLARVARNDFDQQWWLDNCSRAQGYLVFDYELVDAV